jgi:serine/threonine protein kinase/WD40 repeat protein
MRRLVALKILPITIATKDSVIERFYREAQALAALRHPNIVQAYDIDQDNQKHFLVMEYVEGTTLAEMVAKEGPLDIRRAVHLISQAASGLQHAHEAGWVHRDIKPGNLLLDQHGILKILDLGLARFVDDSEAVTEAHGEGNSILGTADYMSPEQGLHSTEVDIRSDIYSLGATLYYLLSGKAPFDKGTTTQKLIWHQMAEPPSLSTLRGDIPEGLRQVMKQMMAKRPEERYQTPAEVVQALAPYLEVTGDAVPMHRIDSALVTASKQGRERSKAPAASEVGRHAARLIEEALGSSSAPPPPARPPSAPTFTLPPETPFPAPTAVTVKKAIETEAETPARRSLKTPVLVGVVVSLVLGIILGGVWLLITVLMPEPPQGVFSVDAPEQATGRLVLLRNGKVVHTVDLTRERHLTLDPGAYTVRLDQEEPRYELLEEPAFSLKPNRRVRIKLQRKPMGRKVTDHVIFFRQNESITRLAFSKDGKRLLACGGGLWRDGSYSEGKENLIRLFEVSSHQLVHTFTGHTSSVTWAAFSPDETRLVSCEGANTMIKVWNVKSGEALHSLQAVSPICWFTCVAFCPDGKHLLSLGGTGPFLMEWDPTQALALNKFVAADNSAEKLLFHPVQERQVFTVQSRGPTQLWDLASGTVVRNFTHDKAGVVCLAVTPEGRYLLTGDSEGMIRLFEVESGKEIRRYPGHTKAVNSLCFDRQGHYFVSGSVDGSVRIWATEKTEELYYLTGHQGVVTSVVLSPDGSQLMTAGTDGTIRRWAFPAVP